MNEKKIKSNRLELLDAIRGITIISMIIFHTLWDLVYIYNVDIDWYKGSYGYLWQQGICWTFILLSGFCFSVSLYTIILINIVLSTQKFQRSM